MSPTPESHARWIEARERSLRDPEGWLSLVALHWLSPGETTIDADGDATAGRVVLAGALASPAMTIGLDDDGRVTATPAPGITATLDDTPIAPGLTVDLRDDRQGPASVLRFGRLHLTHIHRQHRAALRIRDREAPTRMNFRGIPRFDHDSRWAVEARFQPAPPRTTVPVTLITEHVEDHPIAGTLHFEIDGVAHSLLAEASGDQLFVVFGDETNRRPGTDGTYGGGRFLTVAAPDTDGRTVVDFNRAVNPPCSFTPYATCPTPTEANRLSVPVTAGERRVH